ncbi:MAG: GIY-YIG nuclease family protein [Bacteroidales bacterium]|nr:GIY-YIG nuclease family protein [Bacteroidales bacterium]
MPPVEMLDTPLLTVAKATITVLISALTPSDMHFSPSLRKLLTDIRYIMTNKNKTVLYVGVTSTIKSRIKQHKEHFYKGSFTDKYNCEYLVYYEVIEGIENAIKREKQIKAGSRQKKIDLINSINPEWKDLWEEILKR